MPIKDYSPKDHGAFVYSYFRDGARQPLETLDDLIDSGARIAVFEVSSDAPQNTYAGFAIVTPDPQTVVWVHVKPAARNEGLARTLLEYLGINLSARVNALFWSPYVPKLKRRGYKISLVEVDTKEKESK